MASETWTEPPQALGEVILQCARFKAGVVGKDERETSGLRAILNLGHTVGHAIETAAGYGTLLHGEAVALGLIAACRVSHSLGLCSEALETQVASTLARAQLDTDIGPWCRKDVIDHIKVDKKRTGTHVAFITVCKPGQIDTHKLTSDELERILTT